MNKKLTFSQEVLIKGVSYGVISMLYGTLILIIIAVLIEKNNTDLMIIMLSLINAGFMFLFIRNIVGLVSTYKKLRNVYSKPLDDKEPNII